jgi:hypothetical protein
MISCNHEEIVTGMGATLCYPEDKVPYVVTAIKGNTVIVQSVNSDDLPKSGDCNGFPVFDHTFTAEELEARKVPQTAVTLRCHKDGRWYNSGGTRFVIGYARYFRNYAS